MLNRRDGGTIVSMPIDGGSIEYHFKPRADGAHIADVDEQAHVDRFMDIPEGFREAAPEGKPAKRVAKPEKQAQAPKPLVRIEPPDGFPKNLADMSRAQLLEYAAQLSVPGDVESLSEDMIRLNVQSTIDLIVNAE